MATKKDLIDAQTYSRRRLLAAFTSGAPGGKEVEPTSPMKAVIGGVVYRGRKLPKLNGVYIYGDWETGKCWALRHDAGKLLSNEELCDTSLKPVAFALSWDAVGDGLKLSG